MHRIRREVAVLAGTLLLAAVGCGGVQPPAVSSSNEEATVEGTVKIKGKPPTKAKITFDPSNIHRQVGSTTVDVKPDGTYSLKTLAGENNVTVASPETDKDPALSTNSQIKVLNPGANTVPIDL